MFALFFVAVVVAWRGDTFRQTVVVGFAEEYSADSCTARMHAAYRTASQTKYPT